MKKPSLLFIAALVIIAAVAAWLHHDLQGQRAALRLSLASAAMGGTGYSGNAAEDRARRDEFLRASGWDEVRISADRSEQALAEISRQLARRR